MFYPDQLFIFAHQVAFNSILSPSEHLNQTQSERHRQRNNTDLFLFFLLAVNIHKKCILALVSLFTSTLYINLKAVSGKDNNLLQFN